ncbi:hypothetical protein BBP40_002125 [Aspergillus hancockii]|nr:hypothetical protein BBP40_002125 [Aspergillus hancockii]
MTNPSEYRHLNSVAKYGVSYLVSSRYMCSIFLIYKNGNRPKRRHLHPPPPPSKHKIQLPTQSPNKHPNPRKNNPPPPQQRKRSLHTPTKQTTGMTLSLDLNTKTSSLVNQIWDAAEPVFAESQGSYQNLSNGHVLMHHGAVPKLKEHDENGTVVMRAWSGYHGVTQSYRGYRFPWVGRPWTRPPRTWPDVVACSAERRMAVYVSWNGATNVREWRVWGEGGL